MEYNSVIANDTIIHGCDKEPCKLSEKGRVAIDMAFTPLKPFKHPTIYVRLFKVNFLVYSQEICCEDKRCSGRLHCPVQINQKQILRIREDISAYTKYASYLVIFLILYLTIFRLLLD